MATQVFIRDREHIYVNAVLRNDTDEHIPCKINVAITNPLIRNTKNYKMCIVRFDVPLTHVQKHILKESLIAVTPAALGFVYQNRLYLYSYSLDRWPQLRKLTDLLLYMRYVLTRAFWTLIVVTGYGGFPNPIGTGTSTVFDSGPDRVINWPGNDIDTYNISQSNYANAVPYFYWRPEPSLLDLVYPARLQADNILLVIHKSLFRFLNAFPHLHPGTSGPYALNNTVPDEYFAIKIPTELPNIVHLDTSYPNNANYNFTTPHGTTFNSYKLAQEYNVSYKFNTIEKVVIHTAMPLRQELKPDLKTSKLEGKLVLTDYSVPIEKWGSIDQILHYFTNVFDRWIDLATAEDITDISFDFEYEDIYGNISDIILEPGETANIKIIFKSI